ncbi:DUF2269 family protein [Oceanobacillus piezotolerans]|uniref:DUF2269 family protein n=1 Tax=Oceanobacillus piezotolerans TaxID=2448030 RepID=A0A498DA22_9BACI|nr:DUF2269 family protein [Oceanobacillus piezotolerans]RLL45481.1 DUF2269 family protein [Oceanobacillus piezotolerans]
MDFYSFLVGIHVTSAIIAIGPLFIVHHLYRKPKDKQSFLIAHVTAGKISRGIDAGFGLQLVTGLLMGVLHQALFQMLWYNLSISLFFFTGLYFNFVVKRKVEALRKVVDSYEGTEIPSAYFSSLKKVAAYEWGGKGLVCAIILLMVFKP